LKNAVEEQGIKFTDDMANKFEDYYNLLIEWNKKINLTAITEKEDVYKKHFVDSIKAISYSEIKGSKTLIDVGTGAGLPGIPIKIILPELEITLLDSLNKRVVFLEECIAKLRLDKISAFHGRAEDFAQDKRFREKFDIVISRAVANLPVLVEICLGFSKIGGYFVALKGPSINDELIVSDKVVKLMGGKVLGVRDVIFENTEFNHKILVIEKIKHTPRELPRKAGTASKNPL
jgi:16S rRNA (guanine527-N7)-methyltransferase